MSGEVFPDPVAPLSWTLAGIPGAEHGWRDAFERFGVFDQGEFSDEQIEILGVFGGYCYLNVSISRIFGVRVPGLTPELVDYSLFGEQPDVLPYQSMPTDESPEHTARINETLGWILTAEDLPELVEHQRQMEALRASRPDLSTLDDRQLVERTCQLMDEWFRKLFAEHLFISYCSMVPTGIITTVCTAIGQPELAMKLVAGVGGVDSAAPSWAMWDLGRLAASSEPLAAAFNSGVDGVLDRLAADPSADAKAFLDRFDALLYEFGSRGPNEWEMRCPTWETHPELALTAIDRMRLAPDDAAPTAHHHALAAERAELGSKVSEMLADDPEGQGQFQAGLARRGAVSRRPRALEDQHRAHGPGVPDTHARVRPAHGRGRAFRRSRPTSACSPRTSWWTSSTIRASIETSSASVRSAGPSWPGSSRLSYSTVSTSRLTAGPVGMRPASPRRPPVRC